MANADSTTNATLSPYKLPPEAVLISRLLMQFAILIEIILHWKKHWLFPLGARIALQACIAR